MMNYLERTERRKGFVTMDELTRGFDVHMNGKSGEISIVGTPGGRTYLEGRKLDQMYLVLSSVPCRENLSPVENFLPLTDDEIMEYVQWCAKADKGQKTSLSEQIVAKLKVTEPVRKRAHFVSKRLTEARRYGITVDGDDGDYALGLTQEEIYVPVPVRWRFTKNPPGAYFDLEREDVKLASEISNLDIIYLAMSATPAREDMGKDAKIRRAQVVADRFNSIERLLSMR